MSDYATMSSIVRDQKEEPDTKSVRTTFKEATLFDGILPQGRPIYKSSNRRAGSASKMKTGRPSNNPNTLLSQLGSFNLLKRAANKTNSSLEKRAKEKKVKPRLITKGQLVELQEAIVSNQFYFKGFFAKEIKKKDKKTFRGLSISSAKIDRVVYKALLYILLPVFKDYISSSPSYGVLKKKGLHRAMKDLVGYIDKGYEYVLIADIKSFFNQIPKWLLKQELIPKLPDNSINRLISQALVFEYRNIPNDWDLFPDYNRGIAQGTALSPLFADIFLKKFDIAMKDNGFVVLRYVDDFILLGKTKGELHRGYLKARSILKTLRLDLYEYNHKKCKPSHLNGFPSFLGIDIGPRGYLRPNKTKLHTFKQRVDTLIEKLPQSPNLEESIKKLNNAIEGWSGAYKICNRDELEIHYTNLNRQLANGLLRLINQKRIKQELYNNLVKRIKEFKYPQKKRKNRIRKNKVSRPSYGLKPSKGQLKY